MQGAQRIERSAALLGSTLCIALAAVTWRSVSESQETWPFPALYFVELMTLGVVVATAYLRPSTSRAWIALAAAGAILAFCILGAWTVGLLFLPAGAAIAAAALITAVRYQERLGAHAGIFVAAALFQAALMLGMATMF